MIDKTAPVYAESQAASARTAAIAAIMLGMIILFGAGFANSHALHEGTHDTRHAFGLPCH